MKHKLLLISFFSFLVTLSAYAVSSQCNTYTNSTLIAQCEELLTQTQNAQINLQNFFYGQFRAQPSSTPVLPESTSRKTQSVAPRQQPTESVIPPQTKPKRQSIYR